MKNLLLALLLTFTAGAALAQQPPAAVVDGVQMPAWLERDGRRQPLVPGMALRAGDRILTGDGSRVLMKLAGGSVVKLGENGTLRIAEMEAASDVLRAALEVVRGAFRFTTGLVKERRADVSVLVDQVTVGVRGTDFWGRSRDARQIVCLIEGVIQVAAPGEAAVTMDQPRQFYQRENGRTQPVGFVEPAQLQQWALETEIPAGQGATRAGGRFTLRLAGGDVAGARALRDRLAEAGYPARRNGSDVVIRNLASRADVDALAKRLAEKFGAAAK